MITLRQRVADLLAGGLEVAHVHRAIGPRGRSDAQEDHFGVLDGFLYVVRELDLAGGVVLLHQFLEPRLKDRTMTIQEGLELARILLDAAHVVPNARQAYSGDQAHITAADDSNIHRISSLRSRVSLRFARRCNPYTG